MRYRPLFSLKIRHDYYLSNECPDFTVKPTAACEQQLKNYRLHWKETYAGVEVYAQVDDETNQTLLPLSDGLTFSFLLYLRNPEFVQFTDLPASYGGEWIRNPLFANPPQSPGPELVTDHFQKSKPDEIIEGPPGTSKKVKYYLSKKKHSSGVADMVFDTDEVKRVDNYLPDENAVLMIWNNIVEESFSLTYPAVVDTNALQVSELQAYHTDELVIAQGEKQDDGRLLFSLSHNLKPGAQIEDLALDAPEAFDLVDLQVQQNTVTVDPGLHAEGRFAVTYPVRSQLPWGSFARVEIKVHERSTFARFTPKENPDNNFVIAFKAKKFYWKYWLIPEMAITMTSLSFENGETVQTPANANDYVMIHQFELLGQAAVATKFYGKSFGLVSSKRNLLSGAAFENAIKGFRGDASDDLPMEDDAYERFYEDLLTIEQKIGLAEYPRIYFFSGRKIPCREKYHEYPKMKVTGPENYSASFYLMPPALGTDQVRIVRMSRAFKASDAEP